MKKAIFMCVTACLMSVGALVASKEIDIECHPVGDLSYNMCWQASQEDILYHFFGADDWEALMPLSSPEAFIASPDAFTHLVTSTNDSNIQLKIPFKHLRIIAERTDEVVDIARLLTFEVNKLAQEKPLIDLLTAAKKLVTPVRMLKKEIWSHGLLPKWRRSLYSSEITPEIWKEVSPYLVNDLFLKMTLDKIFSKSRVLKSEKSLQKAGFEIIFQQLNRGLIVVRHPSLPKYLLKLYLDSSPRSEWSLWVLRAEGARFIQQLINKYGYQDYLRVPEKWIYPIFKHKRPLANDSVFPKDFVLVVRNMKLCTKKTVIYRYREKLTRSHLQALYRVITEGGLSDSLISNVPLARDGKIAFIDTEYVQNWPVHPYWLTKYFSPLNQQYWHTLMQGNL